MDPTSQTQIVFLSRDQVLVRDQSFCFRHVPRVARVQAGVSSCHLSLFWLHFLVNVVGQHWHCSRHGVSHKTETNIVLQSAGPGHRYTDLGWAERDCLSCVQQCELTVSCFLVPSSLSPLLSHPLQTYSALTIATETKNIHSGLRHQIDYLGTCHWPDNFAFTPVLLYGFKFSFVQGCCTYK